MTKKKDMAHKYLLCRSQGNDQSPNNFDGLSILYSYFVFDYV